MKRRARPVVLSGALLLAAGLGAGAAEAPAPPTDVGGQTGTLSDKLRDNDGVIHPQDNIDTGMQKPTPQTGTTMPVVPPPGDPGIVPK